jgi:hypothetical protein
MQDPKLVAKTRGAASPKTPERIYQVLFLGLMQSLIGEGWEVKVEARVGGGFVDLSLLHKRKRTVILIELKSSQKREDMEDDADKALEQIVIKNYRNRYSHRNICRLREYGIAAFHLGSVVKGRYLELEANFLTQTWVEKDDPARTMMDVL